MKVLRSAILRFGAVALVAMSVSAASAQTTPAPIKLHVGMIPNEPAALVYYAKDQGFFEKAGLDVDIEPNSSTPALAAAVASGAIDITYTTLPTIAIAHTKGLPFTIISPGVQDNDVHFGGGEVVGYNTTITSGKDFNGKTIGVAGLGTIAEFLPRSWIDKHGGDSSTVKFIEVPFPESADAIASGRIFAAYLAEPFVTIGEKKKQIKLMKDSDDALGPEYISTAWFSTIAWAKANPVAVTRWQIAMRNAAIWANANHAATVPLLQKYLKVDPELTMQTRRPFYAEKINLALMQPYIDVTAKYAKFPTFPAADIVYNAGK